VKAVILNDQRGHELVNMADPAPSPTEVLVRPHFCGICGSDLHAPELELFRSGVVSGHEFAGEVVAVGREVTGFSVGQAVTANPNGKVCHDCRYCREGRYNLCRVATWDNPLARLLTPGYVRCTRVIRALA
jgi:threonine dehydrogenase-like Zn-dependent dehydrogenase